MNSFFYTLVQLALSLVIATLSLVGLAWHAMHGTALTQSLFFLILAVGGLSGFVLSVRELRGMTQH